MGVRCGGQEAVKTNPKSMLCLAVWSAFKIIKVTFSLWVIVSV